MKNKSNVKSMLVNGEIFTILHLEDMEDMVYGYTYIPGVNSLVSINIKPIHTMEMRAVLRVMGLAEDEIDYLLTK